MIIAEVAQAHDGSLGMAHAFIDAIAAAGADAVKFQTHIAAAESTAAEPWRVKFSTQDRTRFEYWQRMEFTEPQWAELRSHAEEKGLLFLSSPFSVEAVELLTRVGVPAWKIASGEIGNVPMMQRILATKKPVILSTGMSSYGEIDAAVSLIKSQDVPLTLLQCTSSYPSAPEDIGLNVMQQYAERYRCPVGLSDHSGTIFPGLAAFALGASVVEVHVTLSREMFGPDVAASVTTEELRTLVEGARFIRRSLNTPVDKDQQAARFAEMRSIFGKSAVARADLAAGTVLQEEHIALKKPGTGIPPQQLAELIGRRLVRAVSADEMLTLDCVEQN